MWVYAAAEMGPVLVMARASARGLGEQARKPGLQTGRILPRGATMLEGPQLRVIRASRVAAAQKTVVVAGGRGLLTPSAGETEIETEAAATQVSDMRPGAATMRVADAATTTVEDPNPNPTMIGIHRPR